MPYLNSSGIRIHYQVDGYDQGPPLVLIHGTTQSLGDWYDLGWVEGLRQDYRLILIDLRGLGHSDKPHDSEQYALELYVSDIVHVLDVLGIDAAHYFGFSRGGWIAFGLAKYAPERVCSLIIGASHAFAKKQNEADVKAVFGQGIEAYVAQDIANDLAKNPDLIVSDWYRLRFLANDHQALIAMYGDRPDLTDVLGTMHMPCLIYVGEDDSHYPLAIKSAEKMPNAEIISLPKTDHYQTFLRSQEGLPLIRNFLKRVSS